MQLEQFETLLRQHLRQEPFQPFVVELIDGAHIEIDQPSVAFSSGRATFITQEHDLVDFFWDAVRDIRPAKAGAAS